MPLFNILFDKKQRRLFGLHSATEEIWRLMQSNKAVGALISPWIASRLSSLSVVSECLHQLHLFKPWSRKLEDDMERDDSVQRCNYDHTFQSWIPIKNVDFEKFQVYQFADPTDGKFNYPVYRRRNKQNTATLRKAEANLDAFWTAVDQHYKSDGIGSSQHDLVAHLLRSDRAIQRTPAWVEPEKTNCTPKSTLEQAQYVYRPFSAVFHDTTKQITGTFDRSSLFDKTPKSKTRGTVVRENDAPPGIPQETNGDRKFFEVGKRTHRVFRTLFHSPNNPDTPGELPWVDFLHAMVSVGFSAEKLHASAWNFTPRILGVGLNRSIQFHEPHPSNKIPFLWARRYGRRLGRAYGWDVDAFRLA